jgi:hypothetical protein
LTNLSLFNLINNAILGVVEFSKDFKYKNIMDSTEETKVEGEETPVMPMGEEATPMPTEEETPATEMPA